MFPDVPAIGIDLLDIRLEWGTKKVEEYNNIKEEGVDKNLHVAIRAAWFTLFENWKENDELFFRDLGNGTFHISTVPYNVEDLTSEIITPVEENHDEA